MADLDIDIGVDAGNTSSVLGGVSDSLGSMSASALDAAGSLGDVGVTADDLSGFMDVGQRRADALARAQNEVEQASLDMEQATRDASQAQLDINQAQRDGVQAGLDLEQAQLDQKVATEELAEAEKEFGKGSLEAQQATLDLKQANEDVKQAKEDDKQATEDQKQAVLDGKQATVDAKDAQLNLNQAQRDVVPAAVMNSWVGTAVDVGSALFGLIGIFGLLQGGMLASAAASAGAALTTVGSWIAMGIASLVGAAQVALAWIIASGGTILIVAAIIALVALVIANWDTIKKKTIEIWNVVWKFLTNLWDDIVGFIGTAIGFVKDIFFKFAPLGIIIKNWGGITGWIKTQWDAIKRQVSGAVDRIGSFFSGMWDGITAGLRSALNGAIGLINSAISGINQLISGANRVPGVSIPFIPFIPFLADGGITTGPTVAMIGEGREQEAVLPLSKLQGLINMRGQGSQRVVFELRGGSRAFREFFQESVRDDAGGDVFAFVEG